MAVMTDLFKRILEGQVVRYVAVFNLDDALKEKKPKEKKFACDGRIEHEITNDEIVLTMGRDTPKKETITIPITDDFSFGIRPIGEAHKLPPDAPCFRMELFSEKLKLATTLDFVDKNYKNKQ
jgi:hypothetical protein